MDAEKQAAIDKILKLLELGKEDNGAYTAEQEVANTMAAKLMAKFSIDFSDLKTGGTKKSFNYENRVIDPLDVVYCGWEASLAHVIAECFDCKTVSCKHPTWTINFLGTKTDLEISIFFYRHLRRTICRKSELEFRKRADQDTYAYGMVKTISSRLKDLYTKRQEVMQSDCRDLVIVKTDGLQEFTKSLFPTLRKASSTKLKGSSEAWNKGINDGHRVGLNRPIAGGNSRTASIGA